MKLIEQYSNVEDAEAAQARLRKRGILTYISFARSNAMSGYFTGALKVGLWATFNNQYVDACKILSGKPCKVRYPLTEREMLELEQANKEYAPRAMLKFLFLVLGAMVSIMTLLYLWQKNA